MKSPDLDSFGPWHLAACTDCEVVKLVCGPEGGEQRCGPCWCGESPARPHRDKAGGTDPLFDVTPYQRRAGGA